MKQFIGWIFTILGGLFCFTGVMCIPVAFAVEGIGLLERIFYLFVFIALTICSAMLCRKGLKLKRKKPAVETKSPTPPSTPTENLMTSQFPALYLQKRNNIYRDTYINKLISLGFKKEDAEKVFQYECDVISKYGKQFLLEPKFTQNWFFGLKQPHFQSYPKSKEDILKEKSLTISELCKIIDEAEWHFWNSHEKNVPDSVWEEICQWRLKGPGAKFAIRYFEMIAQETGVPMDHLASLSAQQGAHLSRYKWH